MKKIALVCGLFAASMSTAALSQGSVHVKGHTRSDGTYVPAHTRTAPNSSRTDNWSSQGNVNPRTGEAGTVDPYAPKPYGTSTRTRSNPFGN